MIFLDKVAYQKNKVTTITYNDATVTYSNVGFLDTKITYPNSAATLTYLNDTTVKFDSRTEVTYIDGTPSTYEPRIEVIRHYLGMKLFINMNFFKVQIVTYYLVFFDTNSSYLYFKLSS